MASVAKRQWTYKGKKSAPVYVVRWKVGDTQPSKQFSKKHDADAFKRKVEREIEEGQHVLPSAALTIKEVSERFMRWQEDRVRDGRITRRWLDTMSDAVRLNIVPQLGARRLADLTSADVTEFYSVMRRSGRLSPVTAKHRVKIFGAIVDYGRKIKAVRNTDFMREAGAELRGIVARPVRVMTLEEMQNLLRVVSQPHRNKRANHMTFCYVLLGGFCGLRFGEIGALSIGDIDLDGGRLQVRHSLSQRDEIGPPKTAAGNRSVPMPSFVVAAMRAWLANHYVANQRKLVFRQRDGGFQCNNSFRTGNWNIALYRAGLIPGYRPADLRDTDVFHFHSLRHFCASWWVANGMSIADVARLLGHSKFDMTLRTYTHSVLPEHRQHAMIEQMAVRLIPTDCARNAQEATSL